MVEDPADLPNAIALNSTMVNASRIVGPSIGGLIIAAVGEGWCFLLDGVSYVAVIVSLLLMRLAPTAPRARRGSPVDELREGWRYVSRFAPVRTALVLLAVVGVVGMPYSTLMPIVATTVFGGGPRTLGFLMTASGLGAVAAALYLASRRSVLGLGRVIATATITFGLGLIAFGVTRALWVAFLVLPVVGASFMLELAATNTIVQTITEERLRGRVMAFYTMAFLGSAPIGALLAGYAADRLGASTTIVCGGAACVLAGVWVARRLPLLREQVRPIYVERGVLAATNTVTRQAGA